MINPLLQDIYKVSFKKEQPLTLEESVDEFSSQLFDLYCQVLEDIGAENANEHLRVNYKNDIGKEYHRDLMAGFHALELMFRSKEYEREIKGYEREFLSHALSHLKDKEKAESLMLLIENIAEDELDSLDYKQLKEASEGAIEYITNIFGTEEDSE